MTDNLIDILQRLSKHHVDFVIIGGFAAVAHGSSMVTQDIDICCDFSEKNLFKLHEAIKDLHPVHRLTPKRIPLQITPEFCRGLKNLYLDTDLGILDCLSSVLGIGEFKKVKKCSILVKGMHNHRIKVLSLEALIKAKKIMGRPKDKETLIQLKAIRDLKP